MAAAAQVSSDSEELVELEEKANQGDVSDVSDPELQAELEYARKNNLDPKVVIPMKLRLRQAKKKMADAEMSVQKDGLVKVPRSQKNLRKSRAAKLKGGGSKAEKNSRSAVQSGLANDPPFLDDHDPNYDSETQGDVILKETLVETDVEDLEPFALSIIKELYANSLVKNAVDRIKDLNLTDAAKTALVRIIVTSGMDQTKLTYREMDSQLIDALRAAKVISRDQFIKGFEDFLKYDLLNLSVDYVDAALITGNFLARAVADLVVPEKFIADVMAGVNDWNVKPATQALIKQVLVQAEVKLMNRRILHSIWTPGGGVRPVRGLQLEIRSFIDEYLVSREKEDIFKCLKELEVPNLMHEAVFQAGYNVMASNHAQTMQVMTDLLQYLYSQNVLNKESFRVGFATLYRDLPDLGLDMPWARPALRRWEEEYLSKWSEFPREVLVTLPSDGGRQRIVSECSPLTKVQSQPVTSFEHYK